MMQRTISVFVFLVSLYQFAQAQITIVPIRKDASITNTSLRTEDISLSLPFWDDFSDATTDYPKTDLWLYANSAWVNTGMGIDPPSLKVVTLDGLDSLGKPYNVNDVLAKGFADKMISHPIRLDQVEVALRSTVYLSFYYQFQGNGEAPDAGDILSLSFKTQTGAWERVWFAENDGTLNKNVFVQILIPINAARFFHDTFQFRFQNFGRLSGPYDTWNLDYIYLNKGRSSFDNSYPDRSITTPLTSLLKSYRAVPAKHFFENPTAALSAPSFSVYNFRIGNNQPLNYFSAAEIKTYKNGNEVIDLLPLDNAQDIGSLIGLQRKTAVLTTLPSPSAFDPDADSIKIKIDLTLTTKDNELEGPPANGDYDPAKYSPIDFRKNDVLSANFALTNMYAYDDGSAEYGAGLNQSGAQFAYQFDMITTQSDTLVAVDVYFPRFGDETSQVIQLVIWKDLEGSTGTVLHQQTLTVNRSAQNKFVRIPLTLFTRVQGRFYVGWRQSSAAIIALGLDKSANSGEKMFFNTNGSWEQNRIVVGNLMLRPIFGKGNGIVTSIADEANFLPYPNPTQRSFHLPKEAENINVYDLQGRPAAIDIETMLDSKLISLQSTVPGLHIVRYQLGNRAIASKVMVQGQ